MANVDRPNGFKFAKSLTGHAPNAMARKYPANNDRTATVPGPGTEALGDIYLGDAVTLTSGYAVPFDSGDEALGVVVGVGTDDGIEMGAAGPFNADNLEQRFLAADELGFVWVIPAEGNIFEVQAVDNPANPAYGDLADVTPDTATVVHGNRATSRSIQEITFTAVNNDVRVVEYDTVANDITDPEFNSKLMVMFNNIVNATT